MPKGAVLLWGGSGLWNPLLDERLNLEVESEISQCDRSISDEGKSFCNIDMRCQCYQTCFSSMLMLQTNTWVFVPCRTNSLLLWHGRVGSDFQANIRLEWKNVRDKHSSLLSCSSSDEGKHFITLSWGIKFLKNWRTSNQAIFLSMASLTFVGKTTNLTPNHLDRLVRKYLIWLEGLPRTNTLAYSSGASVFKKQAL